MIRFFSQKYYVGAILLHYMLYLLIFCLSVIALSSVGAFFHFLLNHEMNIIESWLHLHYWQIIIFSKILAFLFFYFSFQWRQYQEINFKTFLSDFKKPPSLRAFVFSIFWLLSGLLYFGLQWKSTFQFSFMFFELILGNFLFYFFDVWILLRISTYFREEKINIFHYLMIVFFFYVSLLLTIPDYFQLKFIGVVLFTQLLALAGSRFQNLSDALIYFILFIIPSTLLWGWDIVWGDEISLASTLPFKSSTFIVSIWVVSWFYMFFKNKKNYNRSFI